MGQSSHVTHLMDSINSQGEKQCIKSAQTHNLSIYKLEDLIAMQLGQGLILAPYDAQRYFELGGKSSVSCPLKPSDSAPLC